MKQWDKCRVVDLKSLEVGDEVLLSHGTPIEVVAAGPKVVTVEDRHGAVSSFLRDAQIPLKWMPLAWLNGYPLYVGDTFYSLERDYTYVVLKREDDRLIVDRVHEAGGSRGSRGTYFNLTEEDEVAINPNHKGFSVEKPSKTININGFEIPEPIRKAPPVDTEYYTPNLQSIPHTVYTWRWLDDDMDKVMLERGLAFLKEEDALKFSEALISFTKK